MSGEATISSPPSPPQSEVPPRPRPSRLGWSTLKAVSISVAVIGASAALWQLGRVEPGDPPRQLHDLEGRSAWLLRREGARLVVAERPLRIDRGEMAYQISDARSRLLPPGRVVYIDREGLAQALPWPRRIPLHRLQAIFPAPSRRVASLPAVFEKSGLAEFAKLFR